MSVSHSIIAELALTTGILTSITCGCGTKSASTIEIVTLFATTNVLFVKTNMV